MPNSLTGTLFGSLLRSGILLWLTTLTFSVPVFAQVQQPSTAPQATVSSPAAERAGSQSTGTGIIMGAVVDKTGAAVAGARIELTGGDRPAQETVADAAGQFFFANVAPGPFQLTVTAQGFATQTTSGVLNGDESYTAPPITMRLATVVTEVHVSPAEEAKVELHAEEQQRVLGVIPNFYVTYVADAVPLSSRQKFQLAWKTTIDPVTFVVTGATAGFEQATDFYGGYGQGAQGYGKRFGASYADNVIGTFIGGAILPSLLKQDPRYFYRGTGTIRSRIFYSIATAVICKGDNGRWQANYSNIGGNFAASAIANAYYPASDRGVGLTFESALIGIGASSGAALLEEFLVPRLTPNFSHRNPPQP